MEIKIEIGKRYLVKNLSNRIRVNALTNEIEAVIIVEISPNKLYARSIQHGWFPIEFLDILDILDSGFFSL